MRYKRKCPACGTLLLIETDCDDGNVFAQDSMECPVCDALLTIQWKPSVAAIEIDHEEPRQPPVK